MEIGMIGLWSGAIVDIPANHQLCDGTNGTPDLRDRFVVGSGLFYTPDEFGGAINHNHPFTGDGHDHTLKEPPPSGNFILAGGDYPKTTLSTPATGTTDNTDGRPPYYSLAYIQRIA